MTKPKKKKRRSRQVVRLRARAVASLEKSPQEVSGTPVGDVQKLIHELRVHQVELEMQNEQLRHAQFELETSRDRFTLLYDLSPVGYLTLDVEGVIQEANLTAARMLGLDRTALLKKKLARFVAVESQDDFHLNRRLVFTTADRQACELQMRRTDGSSFRGRFEGVLEPTGPGKKVCCLVALSDITRHRRAENALRESQAQLAGIIRSAMDAILTVNSQQRIILCNEAAERMFGYPSGGLMGQCLDNLLPKATRQEHTLHVGAFGATGVTSRKIGALGNISGLRADGTEFPIEASISQIEVGGEKLFTVILRDITKRLQLEAEQSRLASIVESSEDAIISRGLDDVITTWNAGAERLFGYTAAEIVGRPFRELVPPDRLDELRQIQKIIGLGEMIAHFQTVRVTKDRRHIPVSLAVSPIKNASGTIVGISGIARDMTRQKEAEESLRRSEAELSDFFTEAPLGLLWVGADGLILRVNRAQLEILGRKEEEVCGRPVSEFDIDPEAAASTLGRLVKKETLNGHRALLWNKDGSIRHVLIDANGLWEQGRLVHSRWFVRDKTRQIELEREILKISEIEKQRLGQELHDDVCQQLTCIEFLAHGLEQQLSAKSKADARRATEIAKMLRETNSHVRELSHGLVPAHLEADGLVRALEELALRTRRVFDSDCRVRCDHPVTIENPEIRYHLFRIAQEAVGNAIKHGRAKQIDIRLAVNGGRLVLGIHDNGAGLPETPSRNKGMGLRLMQYRAGLISGSLVVQREASGGTSVVCSVQLNNTPPKGRQEK